MVLWNLKSVIFSACLLSYVTIIMKVFIRIVHIFMDFTSPVSSVFLTGHSVSDFAAVWLGPLGSLLVPPPLARGKKWSQLLWLLGTV